MPQCCCEIGRADAEQLLSGIERVAVLGREGTGGGHALDIGEQQAAGRQRNDPFDIAQPQTRTSQGRQAGGNIARRRHALRRQPQQRCRGDRQCDDAERDRLAGQQALAEYDQQDRDTSDGENED